VRHVIAQQEAQGLPVVSDGELRRYNFQDSFGNAVAGYDAAPGRFRPPSFYQQGQVMHRVESGLSGPGPAVLNRRPARERLRLVRNVLMDEYEFAAEVASRPVKVTLTGPDRISQRFEWESSKSVYDGLDDFVQDVVAIERQMVGEVVQAGCRYVQLDEPGYTAYVDQLSLDKMLARGEDPAVNLERSIKADNAIIEGFPGVTFGLHVCRGNDTAGWHREGFYDAIAERLFSQLEFQRLLLEYDSERAGSFEPLRFVPKGRIAVLGLVTTKVPEVETVDYLKRRIDDASRYLPLEQLAISPQCGFGHFGEDIQWRKLEAVAETARAIWG
jgi:5-methyltetrahydropteroyltriglutamate--homocysteine methyltransferase